MIKMKEKAMVDMKWLMLAYMMAFGDEDLSTDKVNFGIKMEFFNMTENGNVENRMVMELFTTNGGK